MLARGIARYRAHGLRLLAALGFLAAAGSAAGQAGVWTTHGPAGGNIYCIVPDSSQPSTLYAGTDVGVYKSEDGGASWSAASAGMPVVRVQAIAIDPATATLYAGTLTPNGVDSVGIFKSVDGAASWTPINAGLTDPITGVSPVDIEALAIDPNDHATLLAGTRYSEIFKSTDAGATWQNETYGGFDYSLETSGFVFDPSNASQIYAATTLGLFRSTDGGVTWNQYGNETVPFFTIVSGPASATTLYAGNLTGSGVLKSTDGGAHWNSANRNLPVNQAPAVPGSPLVLTLAVDPSNPSTIYAGTYGNGLFKSVDGASTWAPAGSGLRSSVVATLALAPGQSSTVYAGSLGGGVNESLDAAQTWTPINSGLDLSLVSALVADPAASGTLYAATPDGVQKSINAGASWQAADTGLPVDSVAALALAPGSPQVLFAGTLGGGLLESSDGGATWNPSTQGLADSYISSIAVDPSSPSTLYAGTDDGTTSERVFKSTDTGSTWTQTSLNAQSLPITDLSVSPANPSQVVAVSQGAAGYFQSLDAGKTWSAVTPSSSCGYVNEIVLSPSGAMTYLAGTGGVCRSADGGMTWTVSSVANLASVEALVIDPSDSSTLYAGAAPYVATGTGGVFRSADGGQTWTPVGSGLSDASVTSLVIDSEGNLHAGISGGGVAELVLSQDRAPVRPAPSTGRRTTPLPPR